MSRISKWKLEKTKVKVVFRLQFHATHIPQSGWDKLFISFIPADTGKATAKTTKANVRNGACKWGDPIYETARLLQDSKTKQFDEKLYKIVVAMGSSRASILGEAAMNLADYVDALKPSIVAVPLHGCNFGTVLHITVQLLTSKTGFREFEQQRELRERGFRSGVDGHGDGHTGNPYSEDMTNDQTDKIIARVKSKGDASELSSLDEYTNLNEDYADSNSAAGSETLNAEKHEIDFPKITTSDQSPSNHQNSSRNSNNSIDNELATAFEENTRLKGSLELAESSIFNLKLEVNALQALADELGSETQKLSHHLAAEISSSEELAKEVSLMKSECRKFKDDIIKLKDSKLSSQIPVVETNGFGLDLCQPESILHHFNIITPPVPEVANPAIDAMKTQIFDLVREFDEAKIEKEALVRKMDQMELYYENLIHELEENQKLMVGELKHLTNEHSTCLYSLSSSRAEMELMHQEMLRLADERCEMEAISKELERRAATSEAALRRARLNYSIAVDKLQKDLELLSSQVVSMFETNEGLINQAFVEPSQISNSDPRKRLVDRDILLEDLKRSFCLQEDLCRKAEEELVEMCSVNLSLDIYSKALQESLFEANSDMRIMKKMTEELSEELEISTDSQNQLMVRLQKATEEIHTLNEYKSASIFQCSDMALQNQVLEDKLESVSKENHLLAQKLKDVEITMTSYKSKSETSLAENAELSLSLKHEALENEKLQIEISLLKTESGEVVSLMKTLEETVNFVQDKLGNLLASYDKQLNASTNSHSLNYASLSAKDSIVQLEEIQNYACGRILQLESEREITDLSLSTARLEILEMKKKFKSDIQSFASKLDVSNGLVSKLQAKVESVARKFQFSSEVEEAYAKHNEVFLADIALLENQMQELASENGHLSREISGFDDLAEELGRGKSMIFDLMRDKQELLVSLQEKNEESTRLASAIGFLKEDLKNLHVELCKEKVYKDELEGKVEESVKLSSEIKCQKEDLRNLHAELRKEMAYKDELEGKVEDLTSQLNKDNDELALSLREKNEELVKLASEIDCLKEDLKNLEFELSKERAYKDELEGKVRDLISQLSNESDRFVMSLQDKTDESIKLASEINSLKVDLRNLNDELNVEKASNDELEGKNRDLTSQLNKDNYKFVLSLQEKNEELIKLASEISSLKLDLRKLENELNEEKTCKDGLEGKVRDFVSQLSNENDRFVMSLQDKTDECIKLASEIVHLKEDLKSLDDELHKEKAYKDELEGKFRDLTSQLNEEKDKFVISLQEKTDGSMKLASEINCLKEDLRNLENELHKERICKDEVDEKVKDLNEKLFHFQQQNLSVEKLQEEIFCQEFQLFEMHEYFLAADVELIYFTNQYENAFEEFLQKHMSSEGCLKELQKQYLDLETLSNHGEAHWTEEKSNLLTSLNSLSNSNNGLRVQLEESLGKLEMMETRFSSEERLKDVIIDLEEEIMSLNVAKDELEILVLVLKCKAIEECAEVALLRSQCDELSQKLSEQVLKTEEFKNLSTRLKEMKDKAEAECNLAREKREEVQHSVASQDSLRVAFIKEQYETKNQELQHQVFMSKRHGEEMLIKLQDAIDEIENRKKSEAVNSKRNEELFLKLSALESELQMAVTEKREKISAYDRAMAELECALLSLECCKEEKEKLEASLQEFEAEKSELAILLTLAKGEVEILKSPRNMKRDECGSVTEREYKLNGSNGNSSPIFLDKEESIITGGSPEPNEPTQLQILQDATSRSVHQIPEAIHTEESPKSNGRKLDVNGKYSGAQILRSSMEHLHEELEKMKIENTDPDDNHDVTHFQVPEREIIQLHKANEELRSMFPSFDEISGGGNALEKVLALEIELAEALKGKNRQNSILQSSFLKQHSNDEAVLKSFCDINELIKEMLELKGRHANTEKELREMHERYSQLSLQFAEVEGEREKLKMTLKNVRASRKLLRSSSADHPS